jgi:hypothetical protein
MRRAFVAAIVALAAMSTGGCQGVNLVSRQKDHDIRIDGRLPDWNGVEFVEKSDCSIGLVNDDSCLYVAVIAKDRLVRRQIMISGLYLWFDESGGKNKNFGVCFPVGGMESGDSEMAPRGRGGGPSGERPTPPSGSGGSGPPPRGAPGSTGPRMGGLPDSLAAPPNGGRPDNLAVRPPGGPSPTVIREMMVYSPKADDWARAGKGILGGVEAAADIGRRALVLEIKIPLARDSATGYGIGVRPGQTVGVGIESPEIKGSDFGPGGGPGGDEFGGPEGEGGSPGGPGGGGPPSGTGGGPGGSGGAPGDGFDDMGGSGGRHGPGGGGGEEPRRPEAIKVWGKLALAQVHGK